VVETDYQIYVGIDWGSEAHQACVLDHERRIVAERSFAHAGDAIAEFAQWLRELADDPGRVAIAIEIPRGAIVETLVERGFEVYAINPKQLDRFRDRYSMSGAKDDRETHSSWLTRCTLISSAFAACAWTIRVSSSCGNSRAQTRTCSAKVISSPTACASSSTGSTYRPLSCVRRPTSPGYGRCSSLRHRPALRGACDRSVSSACCMRTAFGASARKKSFPHSRRRR
jgi:hypothetical protein